MNLYRIFLDIARSAAAASQPERVFQSLSQAVTEAADIIARANESGDSEYIEAVVDDECVAVEALLGAAFVTAQATLTGVVSPLMRLHAYAARHGILLTTTDGQRRGLLSLGRKTARSPVHSEVEVIEAFANYFKHRDEWSGTWASAGGRARRVIDVLTAVGASEGSSNTLRVGAEVLGIPTFDRLDELAGITRAWTHDLTAKYESELRGHGVL